MREERNSTHPSRTGHRPALASCRHLCLVLFPLLCRAAGCWIQSPLCPVTLLQGWTMGRRASGLSCSGKCFPKCQFICVCPAGRARPEPCLTAPSTCRKTWQGRHCHVFSQPITLGKPHSFTHWSLHSGCEALWEELLPASHNLLRYKTAVRKVLLMAVTTPRRHLRNLRVVFP